MNTVELIRKKRNGFALTKKEIDYLIQGYSKGIIPDYQMSALMMAIYYEGMNERETSDLTMSIVESGDQMDLSLIKGKKVDKHSTGGVGDTTTLVVAPLVAACGVSVAKLSGRGLGHTGGTIDKLESISGFSTNLHIQKFVQQVNTSHLALMGQTKNVTPADKMLYALRDVTATVDSIPLIASSIMSKKIASGANAIVLDVKVGEGAFLKAEDEAMELAKVMVSIGKHTGRQTVAVVSDMNQPLGNAVGNVLEVREAIETLKGEGPKDLTELSLILGSHMLVLGEHCETVEEAYKMLEECIQNGSAYKKFREFISSQHGNCEAIDNIDLLSQSQYQFPVVAEKEGYIKAIRAEEVGLCAMTLGAGRMKKEDKIDHAVGVVLRKKIGDYVKEGETLAIVHSNKEECMEVKNRLHSSILIDDSFCSAPPLIHCIVTDKNI